MPRRGLEPPWVAPLAPKASASTISPPRQWSYFNIFATKNPAYAGRVARKTRIRKTAARLIIKVFGSDVSFSCPETFASA